MPDCDRTGAWITTCDVSVFYRASCGFHLFLGKIVRASGCSGRCLPWEQLLPRTCATLPWEKRRRFSCLACAVQAGYNRDMSTLRCILCLLTSTSVVFSLSTAPPCAGSLVRTAGRPAAGACQGPRRCCCGTVDGRCCGMACCRMPAKQDGAPGLPKRPDNREQPVALVASAGELAVPEVAWFQSGSCAGAPPTGSDTLITLSIRLNV